MLDYFYDFPMSDSELKAYTDQYYDDYGSITGFDMTKQELFESLQTQNEAKKSIKYLDPFYLQQFLYELSKL
jgi:hypothetical protein